MKIGNSYSRFLPLALFLIACGVQLTLFFIPFRIVESKYSGSTQYGFPVVPFGDYYSYTYYIKRGMEGSLLFKNVYTDISQPLQMLEPDYNLVGFLLRPFGFDNIQLFFFMRLASLVTLNAAVVLLIYKVISQWPGRMLALISFLFITCFWWGINTPTGFTEPELWSNMFDIFRKVLMLPPHYLLTASLVIAMVVQISRKKINSPVSFLTSALIAFSITIIHAYIGIHTLAIVTVSIGIGMVIRRKVDSTLLMHLIIIGAAMAPVLLYYRYELLHFWQSQAQTPGTLTASARVFSITTYLFGLGPLLILAIPMFFRKSTYRDPLLRALASWTLVPIGLFFLPDFGIPMSSIRIFQTYQHIPIAILATLTVIWIAGKLPVKLGVIPPVVVGIAIILYALPAYHYSVLGYTSLQQPYFRYQYALSVAQPMLGFLNTQTKPDSVVIAPDSVSSFIPPFTHNRVVIGQEVNNPNHAKNLAIINTFYSGQMTKQEVTDLIRQFHVSYVIFGIEALDYTNFTNYLSYGVFNVVYAKDGVTVVAPISG